MATAPIPLVTLDRFETEYRGRHLIHAAVDWWAARQPGEAAIVNATRGATLTWADLQRGSLAIAAELARMGFRQGDCLAASLPLLNEHILLELACFRLGVIHAPLDLRLPPAEVVRCLNLIRPKGYFFLGKTPAADFAALGEAVARGLRFHRAPGAVLARGPVHRGRAKRFRPAGAGASGAGGIARRREATARR